MPCDPDTTEFVETSKKVSPASSQHMLYCLSTHYTIMINRTLKVACYSFTYDFVYRPLKDSYKHNNVTLPYVP